MDAVNEQYEAYPYPARDPAREREQLRTGSPSHPVEIDHFLFQGQRDWSQPMRVLVAGGGTGDALMMIGQLLKDRGAPAEITYLDLSRASREIAEARAAARELTVRFVTGDLLTAPDLGPFDYIDCCGVLHHLSDPQAGLEALAAALGPDGGLGAMVYAPYGRTGVYPLQEAFAALTAGMSPSERLDYAREALGRLPAAHPFKRNPLLTDHQDGDAGFYDLLLHSRDRAYRADETIAAVEAAGLRFAGFATPAQYEPSTYLGGALGARSEGLSLSERAALAEQLSGMMSKHIFYAAPAARGDTVARAGAENADALTPVLVGAPPAALAKSVAAKGRVRFSSDSIAVERRLDRSLAPLIALIDGRRDIAALRRETRLSRERFDRAFQALAEPLLGFGLIRFSRFHRRPDLGGGAP